MIEVRTSDLVGAALDWAAAQAEGHHPLLVPVGRNEYSVGVILSMEDGPKGFACRYSTDWSQGGPLIEKYKVGTVPLDVGRAAGSGSHWFATAFFDGESYDNCYKGEGSTALVAACRAIVGLLLGHVVQVPACLVTA